MPTRNISLTAEQDAFVEELVNAGEYQNASEAVRDALRALERRRREDALRLKALRLQIQPIEIGDARAHQVSLTEEALVVELVDGRTITVPLTWYPRLAHGRHAERAHWRLIGDGEGIHWPDLDEDISV